MTKWEFQQIVQRDKATQSRSASTVGLGWIDPILQLEAEVDRHALLLFCGELASKLRAHREKDHH